MFILNNFFKYKDNQEIIGNRLFDEYFVELFVYNNERLLIIEENLSYFSNFPNTIEKFNLIEQGKISDIVHLVNYKIFFEN